MVGRNNIGARLLRDEDERRDMKGTSGVVSALAKEEDGSSSKGTLVSAVGAGGDNVDCTEAEGAVGVQVQAPHPCLFKLEGLGGWTLQRTEAQRTTNPI